jgi:hypothetical protein
MIGESSYTRVPVLQRQLRDFGVVAIAAILIATVAFVAVRNTELADEQMDLARRSAQAVVDGHVALPGVHTVVVSAATPSKKHPYLRHRQVREAEGGWRHLGGTGAQPDDKLLYDAAARFDQSQQPELVEMMRDASGRAIAVRRACPERQTAKTPQTPSPEQK